MFVLKIKKVVGLCICLYSRSKKVLDICICLYSRSNKHIGPMHLFVFKVKKVLDLCIFLCSRSIFLKNKPMYMFVLKVKKRIGPSHFGPSWSGQGLVRALRPLPLLCHGHPSAATDHSPLHRSGAQCQRCVRVQPGLRPNTRQGPDWCNAGCCPTRATCHSCCQSSTSSSSSSTSCCC